LFKMAEIEGEGKPSLVMAWSAMAMKGAGELLVGITREYKVGTAVFLLAEGLSVIAWITYNRNDGVEVPLEDALLTGAGIGYFGGLLAEGGTRVIKWYEKNNEKYQRGEITAELKPIRRKRKTRVR